MVSSMDMSVFGVHVISWVSNGNISKELLGFVFSPFRKEIKNGVIMYDYSWLLFYYFCYFAIDFSNCPVLCHMLLGGPLNSLW